MRRSMRLVTLLGGLAALCSVIAPTAQGTHPRPKGAWPFHASLVPAYSQCTTPSPRTDRRLPSHRATRPRRRLAQATVGTPDAFGGPANFTGSLNFEPIVGIPGPPRTPM